MALTEMQKKIIADNPKASVRDLAKMAKCDPKTITNYRKKMKELHSGESVGNPQENSVENCGKSLTCAVPNVIVGNSTLQEIRRSNLILTPDDLFKIGTEVILKEYELYALATAKLSVDPENPKTLWAQKQHQDSMNKMLSTMGKWHGMDRESVINNILNVNSKVQITSAEKVAQFEQFIREKDPDAL